MNIIRYTNRLNETKLMPITTTQIDSIALHHMAHPTASINEVCGWHMDSNHWDWIGYSFWVALDGTVYECRGLKYLPAAVAQNNGHIISIGFQGDYEKSTEMPEAQFKAGVELIKYLKLQLPNLKTIDGHKKWNSTSCPGKYFPMHRLLAELNKSEQKDLVDEEFKANLELLQSYGKISSPQYWLDNCKDGGKVDGLFAKIVLNKFAELLKSWY